MRDKAGERKMGFKSSSTGPWAEKVYHDDGGICANCGQYDIYLEGEFCRDDDCKRDRLIKALHTGEAMMMKDGTLLWTPGTKIRADID